jgi:hypothetical protein
MVTGICGLRRGNNAGEDQDATNNFSDFRFYKSKK